MLTSVDSTFAYLRPPSSDFSRGANYRSKIRGESSSKRIIIRKIAQIKTIGVMKNAGKFRQNIISSEISSKSQEFRQNLFALLLHSTVLRGCGAIRVRN